MKLEQLLNNLIKKGWKPFGLQYRIKVKYYGYDDVSFYEIVPTIGGCEAERTRTSRTLRDVVSIDSLLRQFCCDKGLVEMYEGWYWQNIFPLDSKEYDYTDYQYWILESSLIDEDKLEKFLLENIKI